jgi:hypothetical protein
MDTKEIMGRLVDVLYEGLTGGSADLPLPQNTVLNFLMPGVPFHESFFDFAVAGPFAGPTPATLDEVRRSVDFYTSPAGGALPGPEAVTAAKRDYTTNLLGCWEQWSRLVDFIPLARPTQDSSQWRSDDGAGKYKHVSVVYAQANRTLSQVYSDTLRLCEVAEQELTDEQKKIVERMRKLLTEEVEVEDLLTGENRKETRPSRLMTAYTTKQMAYENAVIDYATRLARAYNGTAEELVVWNRSGGIYRRRALDALRDWEGAGYKNDVERAQATLSHILGSSMVQWKDNLVKLVDDAENNVNGQFGYSFFPASVIPGAFARTSGWSTFSQRDMKSWSQTSTTTRSGSASLGLNLGLFTIGGSGGGGMTEHAVDFSNKDFELGFEYVTVEIIRPAFNPSFLLSRSWRPTVEFANQYGSSVHSDGQQVPDTTGVMIGYPTKALFVRNLRINSTDLAGFVHSHEDHMNAGGVIGYGPFILGGQYQQSNRRDENNFTLDDAGITMKGLSLVAFLSAVFPACANPSPDIKKWV